MDGKYYLSEERLKKIEEQLSARPLRPRAAPGPGHQPSCAARLPACPAGREGLVGVARGRARERVRCSPRATLTNLYPLRGDDDVPPHLTVGLIALSVRGP